VEKRTFGTVDELPSGRFRARYRGPDGRRHAKVFGTKADAWAWLATQQTDLLRKSWRAPSARSRTVGDYAEDYLARNDLRASTRVLYAGLWRHHQGTDAPAGPLLPRRGPALPARRDDRDAHIARTLDAMLGALTDKADDHARPEEN
jgi:hypothetical protein